MPYCHQKRNCKYNYRKVCQFKFRKDIRWKVMVFRKVSQLALCWCTSTTISLIWIDMSSTVWVHGRGVVNILLKEIKLCEIFLRIASTHIVGRYLLRFRQLHKALYYRCPNVLYSCPATTREAAGRATFGVDFAMLEARRQPLAHCHFSTGST